MKIALIGAQGVGKTTLANKLKQKYGSSYIVKETVRECPYPCDQAADFKTEWWVLSHSILEEKEAHENGHQLIIADRCLLDISVYTKLIHGMKDGRITDASREMIDQVISSWLSHQPYDYVFFIKVDTQIWKTRDLDDGFRSLDEGWYQVLTKEFEEAIERHGLSQKSKLIVLSNNGKLEDALSVITQELDKELLNKSPKTTTVSL